MRHRKSNVKLGRTASHRRAMLRNMATSLLETGWINTTVSKAKAVKPVVDRLVTLAKRGDLHAYRQAAAVVTKKTVLRELFKDPNDRFAGRVSGYTLMARCGPRPGDAATMVHLKLADSKTPTRSGVPAKPRVTDRGRRVAASKRPGAPAGKGSEFDLPLSSGPGSKED